MNGNCRVVNNKFARKIVHEYNVFMKETRARMDETRRATMISLKKLLNLKDGDVIEIKEDGALQILSDEEAAND
jgi:flagellar motor switch protein FliM